jgi:hypothetical protein
MPIEKVYDMIKKNLREKLNKENNMISKVPSTPIMTDNKNESFNKIKRLYSEKELSEKEKNEQFSKLLDSAIKYIELSEDKDSHMEELSELNKANAKLKELLSIIDKKNMPSASDKRKIEEISNKILPPGSPIIKTIRELKKVISEEISNIKNKYEELTKSKDIQRFNTISNYIKEDEEQIVNLIKRVSGKYGKMENLGLDEIEAKLNLAWSDLSSFNKPLITKIAALAPKGYGQGEFFIEFVFDDARTSGGSVSYDISAGSKHYEVKCYPSTDSVIRLGVEGTLTGFEAYHKLAKVYTSIKMLLSLSEEEFSIFENMAISAKNKLPKEYQNQPLLNTLKTLFTSKTDKDGDVTLADKLNSGEFSASNINATQEVFDIFDLLVNSIYENEFEYVKLIKQNKIYPVKKDESGDLAIQINDDGSATIQTNPAINKNSESKVVECINALRVALNEAKSAAKGSKFLEYFKNSISNQINKNFEQHPMILMNSNITGTSSDYEISDETIDDIKKPTKTNKKNLTNDTICFGVYTQFEFKTVSQKGVKVSVVS